MSLIDKAKERATALGQQAKDKVDDLKEQRRADGLLAELGRISFRQHTGHAGPSDIPRATELVAQLETLQASGAAVIAGSSGSATTTTASTPVTLLEDSPLPPPTTPG